MSSNANRADLGLVAGLGSLLATLVTGAACAGPLVAIVLGVGGFGWLAQYAAWRVPASIVTFSLLAAGFVWTYRSRPESRCTPTRRAQTIARAVLWLSAVIAVATNFFEYVVFPHL